MLDWPLSCPGEIRIRLQRFCEEVARCFLYGFELARDAPPEVKRLLIAVVGYITPVRPGPTATCIVTMYFSVAGRNCKTATEEEAQGGGQGTGQAVLLKISRWWGCLPLCSGYHSHGAGRGWWKKMYEALEDEILQAMARQELETINCNLTQKVII